MHRGSNKETTCGLLDFLILAAKLKTTKRTGWVDSNIKNPESISDHMHRMGLISLLIPQSENIINGFNRDRLVKMAIVHDLAECIVGDLTPHCGVTSKDKHQMESDAMELIVGICENSQLVREVKELWVEYESGVTETAKICKEIDKFEMILQAHEYEVEGNHRNLDSFFESTRGYFKAPEMIKLVDQLYEKRRKHHESLSNPL